MQMEVRVVEPRERDREPRPLAQGFAQILNFPASLRAHVPRPDGGAGERDSTYFGPEYMVDYRRRRLLVQADKLHQFAQTVAGLLGTSLQAYVRGGDLRNTVDALIDNALRQSTSLQPPGLSEGDQAKHNAHMEELKRAWHAAQTQPRQREEVLQRREVQNAWERLVNQRDQGRTEGGVNPQGPPPSTSELASTSSMGVEGGPEMPRVGRPQPRPSMVRLNPAAPGVSAPSAGAPTAPLTARAAAAGETQPSSTPVAVEDAQGKLVYGVDDQWLMLLRILLRGANEADLKAWRLLYDVRDEQTQAQMLDKQLEYVQTLQKMHQLLHGGEGGLDWVNAPQHIGMLFFTPPFLAALAMAVSDVRVRCGKHWATDLGLMTHDGVWTLFAELVAHHLRGASMALAARWGGTAQTMRAYELRHRYLIDAFRRLARRSDGIYYLEGASASGGDLALRRGDAARSQTYMEREGRYWGAD